jgi:lipopolysaccharide transport system ATP-binding protein
MNGTILGMSKREIDRKFDEIVEFSGVEKFLDTPIKRYSTGMTVRLAFAVAAHLEPEILIVDEVLAVGDFEFQKRCLGKMHDVAKSGRTVLFVSHQLNAITQLCSRVLYIQSGRVAASGRPEEIVEYYLNEGRSWNDGSRITEWHPDERPTPFFTDILINNTQLPAELILQSNDAISIVLHGDPGNRVLRNFRAGVHVSTQDGIRIMTFATPFASAEHFDVPSRCRLKCTIDRLALIPGTYFLDIGCMDDNGRVDYLRNIARLTVHAGEKTWPGLIPTYKEHGYFVAQSHWTVARSVNGKDSKEMELQLSSPDGAHANGI